MGESLVIALKILFCALGFVMLATLIFTISIDGLPFRKGLLTPWMEATLIDFYINIVALGAWILYKEINWVSGILWLVVLVCFGSITTCGYIALQLFKLSPQESLQDPMYFLVLQNNTKREVEQKRSFSVVSARALFSLLGCLMVGTLVYILITDGSPFRQELFTPWMTTTLIDFYINVAALSVWVVYKESGWISSLFWTVLLVCFGSITTCIYIVRQLFHLSSQDPVSLVLFSSCNRQESREYKASIFLLNQKSTSLSSPKCQSTATASLAMTSTSSTTRTITFSTSITTNPRKSRSPKPRKIRP